MAYSGIDASHKAWVATKRASVSSVTRDMVLNPDADLDSVMDYADELGVDMSGLNNVEEMQNRICMHLDYLDSRENHIETVKLF